MSAIAIAATTNPATTSPATAASPLPRFLAADAPRVLAHLLALDADDRMLRFGHGIRCEGIVAYVAGIDFKRDHVHGLSASNGEVVALAHVALRAGELDFGLSVIPAYRQRGLGRALFEHVMALAPQLGAQRIVCHSISPVVLHMVAVRGFRRPNGDPASAPTLDLGAPHRA